MSTFFWILGMLATAGLTFIVCYFMIGNQLCGELMHERKQLEDERKQLVNERSNFKTSYDEAQQWYCQAWKSVEEKKTELNVKEKKLEEFNKHLEAQIIENNREKKDFFDTYQMHLKNKEAYIEKLESQLVNARQRSKRLAKYRSKVVS